MLTEPDESPESDALLDESSDRIECLHPPKPTQDVPTARTTNIAAVLCFIARISFSFSPHQRPVILSEAHFRGVEGPASSLRSYEIIHQEVPRRLTRPAS